MVPSDYLLPDAAHRDLEAEALLALGRLDGTLGMVGPTTLRLFTIRLLRNLFVAALRKEGHMFTDQRFHAWFAGLATLSDHPPRSGRPPRVLCEAILTELKHSSWDVLAALASRFQTALLAPNDWVASDHVGNNHHGSGLAAETAHQDTHAVVTAARGLLGGLPPPRIR